MRTIAALLFVVMTLTASSMADELRIAKKPVVSIHRLDDGEERVNAAGEDVSVPITFIISRDEGDRSADLAVNFHVDPRTNAKLGADFRIAARESEGIYRATIPAGRDSVVVEAIVLNDQEIECDPEGVETPGANVWKSDFERVALKLKNNEKYVVGERVAQAWIRDNDEWRWGEITADITAPLANNAGEGELSFSATKGPLRMPGSTWLTTTDFRATATCKAKVDDAKANKALVTAVATSVVDSWSLGFKPWQVDADSRKTLQCEFDRRTGKIWGMTGAGHSSVFPADTHTALDWTPVGDGRQVNVSIRMECKCFGSMSAGRQKVAKGYNAAYTLRTRVVETIAK